MGPDNIRPHRPLAGGLAQLDIISHSVHAVLILIKARNGRGHADFDSHA